MPPLERQPQTPQHGMEYPLLTSYLIITFWWRIPPIIFRGKRRILLYVLTGATTRRGLQTKYITNLFELFTLAQYYTKIIAVLKKQLSSLFW